MSAFTQCHAVDEDLSRTHSAPDQG